jgi:POT family proton-dependent oligopeptide transporter
VLATVALLTWLGVSGTIAIEVTDVALWLGLRNRRDRCGLLRLPAAPRRLRPEDKRRILVIVWLFVLAAIFWSGFEQAGSSMNLFANELTNRNIMGWEMPTSWLQNVNPIFIILLAPVFGYSWTWLAHRNRNPSIPMKFALGLMGLSVGFFVLAWGRPGATRRRLRGDHLVGRDLLPAHRGRAVPLPVGLSSITKLAPATGSVR